MQHAIHTLTENQTTTSFFKLYSCLIDAGILMLPVTIVQFEYFHASTLCCVYFLRRLVECDSSIQEEVSKMSPLIDKLLFITDRCQSEPAGYSLFSGQVVSNILFYCTWNVRSAQPLVDCGALEKMLNITKKLLIDKDSNAPLR